MRCNSRDSCSCSGAMCLQHIIIIINLEGGAASAVCHRMFKYRVAPAQGVRHHSSAQWRTPYKTSMNGLSGLRCSLLCVFDQEQSLCVPEHQHRNPQPLHPGTRCAAAKAAQMDLLPCLQSLAQGWVAHLPRSMACPCLCCQSLLGGR
jgi:hypothetical protein